jgi:hypothetical protein
LVDEDANETTPNSTGLSNPQPTGQTLYCFALVVPRTYEVSLLRMQLTKGVGLYDCDGYAVYSNETVELNPDSPVPVTSRVVEGSLQCPVGGKFNTVLNSGIFARTWKQVMSDSQYLKFDWTVKVDADAVFLPQRLRERLRLRKAHSADRVYFNNCKDGLHGPVEIISRAGMKVYSKSVGRCISKLTWEFDEYGEDVFLRHCLGLLQVNRVDDFALLAETFGGAIPQCTSGAVTFHPLKTVDEYSNCLAQTAQVR